MWLAGSSKYHWLRRSKDQTTGLNIAAWVQLILKRLGKFWLHGFFSTTAQNLFDRPDSLKCGRTSNHVCNRLMSAPLFLFLSLIATNWTVRDAAISATVRFAVAEIQRHVTSLSC